MSISTEKMIDSQDIFKGHVLHLTLDTVRINDTDQTSTREVVRHKGACAILPITPEGKIILVRQYRYAPDEVLLEIPAGKIDSKEENPLHCAARELEEEAGVTGEVIPLGHVYTSPGFSDECLYLYAARNLKKGTQHLDEDEFMNIEYYTPEEVEKMIDNNEIVDSKTIACFFKARKYMLGK